MSKPNRRFNLLASSSLAALFISAGAPAAWAACYTGPFPVTNTGALSCINVSNTSFSGNVTNAGTGIITTNATTGILVLNSTINGAIVNNGLINITTNAPVGIAVASSAMVFGGISNSGTISASKGIVVSSVAQFGSNVPGGGIVNTGTISAGATGVAVSNVGTFLGGISNSGTISVGTLNAFAPGISVEGVDTFIGGIFNSGLIATKRAPGIFVDFVSTFSGGVTNTGTISVGAGTAPGIFVQEVQTFVGNIDNRGLIAARGSPGILVVGVSTFAGGITNSGTILSPSTGHNGYGIVVSSVAQFGSSSTGGGISNSGTISAGQIGIAVGPVMGFGGVSLFYGNIVNSGSISAGNSGIGVVAVATFMGGISNSGTISVGHNGIGINVSSVAQFGSNSTSGGITNSGTITVGSGGLGIHVGAATFFGNVSNSGTISGGLTGIFVCSCVTFAGGAIINTGVINGTVAAIDASIATSPVTIDQMAGTISGAIKLSPNADVVNVFGGTINGDIIGQGSSNTLNFVLGSNTFTYGSAFGFVGINQVNVNSGTVILNGTNSATNVTVNGGLLQIGDLNNPNALLTTNLVDVVGGTLAGHGTITGNVTIENGGTLMPGGSIGTLTINGNLVLNPGGIYAVEFAANEASKTQINGTVTLGNANVNAIVTANQFGLHTGNTYTILTTTTPLGAGNTFNPAVSFSGLTNSEKLLLQGTAALSYDANDAFLSVPNYAVLLALPSNAPLNAQNVANAFNNFILGGNTVPAGFQTLANLSGNALSNAVNQLAGQSQGSFGPVGFEAGNQFLNLMLNPYIDGRSGVATSSPPLAYAPQQSSAPAANAFSAIALGPRPFFEPRLSFLASAYGGDGRISGSAFTGAASTNSQIYGVATGVDYLALPNTIFGLALGGGGTAWQLGQGMGNGRSDMFQAGLYGRSQLGPAYVAGAFAYSLHDVTTNRNVTLAGFDSLQGNFSADVLSMRLEGGYRLPYGAVAVTPYGAVQSQDMFLPAYSEFATSGSSQFALNYTNRTFTATRTEIGAWFDSDALMANGIKLYSRFAWAHDFDNEGAATAFFQSLPGSNFLINSSKPARDGALTTVGFEYRLADGWSVLGKFDGEFSSTTAIFAGTGTVRYVW